MITSKNNWRVASLGVMFGSGIFITCPACEGTGSEGENLEHEEFVPCSMCGGAGKLEEPEFDNNNRG